jgi:hypothetical protein
MIETVLQTIHKLTDFKVVFICPDHNEKYHTRKVYMENLLKSKGFKDVVHFKSGNERYPLCLTIAIKDVLTKYLDEPILVLEDDVEIFGTTEFTIPINTDAIYLGLSQCASHPTENYNVYYAQFEPYSDSQVKVKNMLSAHAILYISKTYKEKVIKVLEGCINSSDRYVSDMEVSRIQKDFNVYANKIPIFFQSNKFNDPTNFNVEWATKIQILDDMSIKVLQ